MIVFLPNSLFKQKETKFEISIQIRGWLFGVCSLWRVRHEESGGMAGFLQHKSCSALLIYFISFTRCVSWLEFITSTFLSSNLSPKHCGTTKPCATVFIRKENKSNGFRSIYRLWHPSNRILTDEDLAIEDSSWSLARDSFVICLYILSSLVSWNEIRWGYDNSVS